MITLTVNKLTLKNDVKSAVHDYYNFNTISNLQASIPNN